MDFERNYQVKFPAKQFTSQQSTRRFSILNNININPWFITEFPDAESSFIFTIYKNNNCKLKLRVSPYFSIYIHLKDIDLLKLIQFFFSG